MSDEEVLEGAYFNLTSAATKTNPKDMTALSLASIAASLYLIARKQTQQK